MGGSVEMTPLEMARELVRTLEAMENNEYSACNNKALLSDIPIGGVIKGSSTDYIVLEHFKTGSTAVIAKEFMIKDVKFGDSRNYRGSNIEKQINDKCLPLFEKDFEKENLVYHDTDITSVDMQNEFSSFNAAVRPLTFDEARKYNDLIVNEELDDYTWTCSPWSTKERGFSYSIAVVAPSGSISSGNVHYYLGVRPVCILKSNIFVSKGE